MIKPEIVQAEIHGALYGLMVNELNELLDIAGLQQVDIDDIDTGASGHFPLKGLFVQRGKEFIKFRQIHVITPF